jgi:lipoprotein signal peptidase
MYFPVFNVADSSVTVCGILLVVSTLFHKPAVEPQADSKAIVASDEEDPQP